MLPAYFTLFVCVFASVCYMYHVNWSIITKWCTSAQAVQAPDQVLLAMVDIGQALGENFSVHLLRVEKNIWKYFLPGLGNGQACGEKLGVTSGKVVWFICP